MAAGKVKTAAMIIPPKPPSTTKIKQPFAIVPFLDKEISNRDSEIERSRTRIACLESENRRLRDENEFLREELAKQNDKYEEKISQMQSELSDIKRAITLVDDIDSSPSPISTTKLVDVTNTSHHNKINSTTAAKCPRKFVTQNNTLQNLKNEIESSSEDIPECSEDDLIGMKRFRVTRVPTPPPVPSASLLSSSSITSNAVKIPAPPPPPVKPRSMPPPPPPLPSRAVPSPSKGTKAVPAKVRRVPEVVEFYHSFMRRDTSLRRDTGGGGGGGGGSDAVGANAKDMIGEIENRSAHLLAIKRDVETQGDFIRFLIKQVEAAEFTDIEDVVPFVKWLDDELSYLVDERAVLKHFDWPEQKADALREAAFGYSDLKKLVSEASLFRYDPRQPCSPALKKMQSLFEKLEQSVHSLSRTRESATRRYKLLQIPVNWMMDTGYVSQIKLASVKLAMKYMKRVLAELEIVGGGPEEEELIVQGVKFAFRVHQFAGGFDADTMRVFQELRNKAQLCSVQSQNQHQQKIICRSSSAAY